MTLFTQKVVLAVRGVAIEVKGNKVYLTCPKCGERKPISKFGYRMMTSGEVRNQSWCYKCRSK
jgi:predicted RNA-binding Zn-ribbon protein involved in translation (DUF1610 family)